MKNLIILLLFAGLSMAFTVTPDYFEIQDTGSESLPTMDVGLGIDCDSKAVTVSVMDAEGPVEGASVYMFYTDYTYQALPNTGKTDSTGVYVAQVPGTLKFLTALFIVRVDHSGHQSREIEFAYEKCFEEPPPAEPEPECSVDADCAAGEVCEDEECVEAPGCIADRDCDVGFICENQECVEAECISDADCEQGFECRNNECVELPKPSVQPETPTDESNVTPPIAPPPEQPEAAVCPLALLLPLLLILRLRT